MIIPHIIIILAFLGIAPSGILEKPFGYSLQFFYEELPTIILGEEFAYVYVYMMGYFPLIGVPVNLVLHMAVLTDVTFAVRLLICECSAKKLRQGEIAVGIIGLVLTVIIMSPYWNVIFLEPTMNEFIWFRGFPIIVVISGWVLYKLIASKLNPGGWKLFKIWLWLALFIVILPNLIRALDMKQIIPFGTLDVPFLIHYFSLPAKIWGEELFYKATTIVPFGYKGLWVCIVYYATLLTGAVFGVRVLMYKCNVKKLRRGEISVGVIGIAFAVMFIGYSMIRVPPV